MPLRPILSGGLLAAVAVGILVWFRAQRGDASSPWGMPADDAAPRDWGEADAQRQAQEPAFAAPPTSGAPDSWSSPSV